MTNLSCPRCKRFTPPGRFCDHCGWDFSVRPAAHTVAPGGWQQAHYQRTGAYPPAAAPTDHTRYLAMAHRIYGFFSAFVAGGTFLIALITAVLFQPTWLRFLDWVGATFFGMNAHTFRYGGLLVSFVSLLFVLLINLIFTVPFFAVARGLKRNKDWTKLAAAIAVLLSITAFPFGTALSVYTLWYFFAGPGKARPVARGHHA
jgi:hypothetical protein